MSDIEFYMCAITKAGLSAIPTVGGSLASLIGDIQSARNEKRLRAFITQLSDDLATRIDKIQQDYVSREDFIDVFLNITEDAMKQRQEEKRTLLKNLLINSITTPETSYNVTEELQRLIDLLSPQHIAILGIFYEDREHVMKNSRMDTLRILDNIRALGIKSLFRGHTRKSKYTWAIDNETGEIIGKEEVDNYEDFLDFIRDLENHGLVESFINNVYACDENNGLARESYDTPYITAKGRELIEYVK